MNFTPANQKVIDSFNQYKEWIEKDLKPQAHGDFRIGADNFSKKLLYDESVDIPLPRLLEIGMANLRKNQESFKAVAAKIDPKQDAAADPGRTGKRSSCAGQTVANLPRHPGRPA